MHHSLVRQLESVCELTTSYVAWQESTLLRLAERQAGREEELAAARQRAAELEAELGDAQREIELRQEQETALKEVCASHVP